MKNRKVVVIAVLCMMLGILLSGCMDASSQQNVTQRNVQNTLIGNQPTPTDIEFSLERYNLTRRAYWVNGMREEAKNVECPVEKPLGYVVLFTQNYIYGQYTVDGKVSSLNSFLSADTTSPNSTGANWLADVDGSYGTNDNGIFFFSVDGQYHEWSGEYHYTDTYESLDNSVIPVLHTELDYNSED